MEESNEGGAYPSWIVEPKEEEEEGRKTGRKGITSSQGSTSSTANGNCIRELCL
jgi:hypothetical protein